MIRVEGHSNLYRDEQTGAIINCDTLAYNQHLKSLNEKNAQKREIEQMKSELNDIKNLLKQLLEKNPKDKSIQKCIEVYEKDIKEQQKKNEKKEKKQKEKSINK